MSRSRSHEVSRSIHFSIANLILRIEDMERSLFKETIFLPDAYFLFCRECTMRFTNSTSPPSKNSKCKFIQFVNKM